MKNRRKFLLTLTAGLVAAAVIITPVIAEELFGSVTKVDVEGKKLTVIDEGRQGGRGHDHRQHRDRDRQGETDDRPGEDRQGRDEGQGRRQERDDQPR